MRAIVVCTLAGLALPRLASAQSELSDSADSSDQSAESSADSNASSDDSNASSADSNESSANSNESSDNSNQSSANSDQSSDQSMDESTRNSSEGSSEDSAASSQQPGMRVASIIIAVAVVSGIAVGTGFLIWSSVRDEEEDEHAATLVQRYLRRNHGALVREVVLGDGPVLTAWYDELGLSRDEARAVARRLEGSAQQTELLTALDGPVDRGSARRFARALMGLTAHSIGPARVAELLERHGVGVGAAAP